MAFSRDLAAKCRACRLLRVPRTVLWALWGALLVCMAANAWFPVSTWPTRAAGVLGAGLWWALTALLLWKSKPARLGFAVLSGLLLLFLAFPGRSYSPEELRRHYTACLLSYKGAPYYWGGETGRGIDCSGLVRRGLINADLAYGLKSLNPRLVRQGLWLWWHDCTARQLQKGHLGLADCLSSAPSINALDDSRLLPGDFVVTRDGIHTLAYVGDHTWIEADPGLHQVVTVRVPEPSNLWFRAPVDVMRWRQMSQRGR